MNVADWLYVNYPARYFDDPVRIFRGWKQIEWITSKYEWTDPIIRIKWIAKCIEGSDKNAFDKVVKLLYARQYKDQGEAMTIAARRGDLEMVQWVHKHKAKVTKAAMDSAIIAGHLKIVIWLHNNRSEGCTDVIKRYPHSKATPFPTPMDFAESWNHIDIVKWLHVNKP